MRTARRCTRARRTAAHVKCFVTSVRPGGRVERDVYTAACRAGSFQRRTRQPVCRYVASAGAPDAGGSCELRTDQDAHDRRMSRRLKPEQLDRWCERISCSTLTIACSYAHMDVATFQASPFEFCGARGAGGAAAGRSAQPACGPDLSAAAGGCRAPRCIRSSDSACIHLLGY